MTFQAHYPLHEDSGSTAYDHTGNGYDGVVTGAGPAGTGTVAGTLGATAYAFDGTDDHIDTGLTSGFGTEFTVVLWYRTTDTSDSRSFGMWDGTTGGQLFTIDTNLGGTSGKFGTTIRDNNGNLIQAHNTDTAYVDGTWQMMTVHLQGTKATYYHNAEEVATASDANIALASTLEFPVYIGGRNNGGTVDANFTGDIGNVRIYGHTLSPSEIRYLYDIVNRAEIYTGTKSSATNVKPDLKYLDYALNTEGATMYVIGSPGTASEETQSVVLDGSTFYDLTWANSHTDFRISVVTDPLTDVTNHVEVRNVELVA